MINQTIKQSMTQLNNFYFSFYTDLSVEAKAI